MVYAIRKQKETTGALLRRFTKNVQQSGILLEARRTRFFSKKKNKRARKISALRRMKLGKEREKLMKLGRLRPKEKRPRPTRELSS
ncbi:MAG: 30S ribosomal protein S21 [bacterium]|nr:30S ribosomal protein S21 [bacterium]